ncbi:MAG: hypothetical protein JWL75_369 [Parcubacteria group bacterium]|nr:hypothetical protein [Parcubacteria group bacterium]
METPTTKTFNYVLPMPRGFVTAPVLIAAIVGIGMLVGAAYVVFSNSNSPASPSVVGHATSVTAQDQESTSTSTTTAQSAVAPTSTAAQNSVLSLNCSVLNKSFSQSASFEQLTSDLDAYYKTSAVIKQVQLFLAAYYGLDAKTFATGSTNTTTSINLSRFQTEHGLLASGSMNLLTQNNMTKACGLLADRIQRNVSIPLRGSEAPSLNASIVFNGTGPSKSVFASVKSFFAALQYKNLSTQHVAIVSTPYCDGSVRIYAVSNGTKSDTPVYDNASDRQACEAKEGHILTHTVLPGETISEFIGSPSTAEKLKPGTYEIVAVPEITGVNLGTITGTFTISGQ